MAPRKSQNFGGKEHVPGGQQSNLTHTLLSSLFLLYRSRLRDADLATAAGRLLWRNVLLSPAQRFCVTSEAARPWRAIRRWSRRSTGECLFSRPVGSSPAVKESRAPAS